MYSLLLILILFVVFRAWRKWTERSKLPYPPGPPGLPFLGNLFDMPTQYMWMTFADWSKNYGDIVHVEVFGLQIVVLNNMEVVKDLLDGRSAVYSDREHTTMLEELMGWNWSIAASNYGDVWKHQRKLFHHTFNAETTLKYRDVQTLEARRTALRLIDSPSDFVDLIRLNFATIISQVVYGIAISDFDDAYFKTAKFLLQELADAVTPGSYLVDFLPILKYVPSWMPGAGFQRKAKRSKRMMAFFVGSPYEEAVQRIRRGIVTPSMISEYLGRGTNELAMDELKMLMNVAATAFAAGSDTTVSTIQTFFLVMILFPEVQKRAQAQIDEVVGRDRLPEFNDLERLPYVQAVFKELVRWQPVLPLAVPHRLMREDEYRGYRIPKGAIVLGNSWSILHSEKMYPNPMSFYPERFLNEDGSINPDVPDPDVAAFGFGRRKCPGRFFAANSGLITLATFLTVLDISSSDSALLGSNMASRRLMTGDPLSYPRGFICNIQARSPAAYALLQQFFQH